MKKMPLNSYNDIYSKCEDILEVKTMATSGEILDTLTKHYNVGHLNVTSKGITYYLKSNNWL